MNDFCIKECPFGKEKSKEFLDKNNSVYDAVIDMQTFVKECIKTCPHRDKLNTKED